MIKILQLLVIDIMYLSTNLFALAGHTKTIKVSENFSVINKGIGNGVTLCDRFTLSNLNSPQKYGAVEVIKSMNSVFARKLKSGHFGYTSNGGDTELQTEESVTNAETSISCMPETNHNDSPQFKNSKSAGEVIFSRKTSTYSQTAHALGGNAEIGGAYIGNDFGAGFEVRVSIGLFYAFQKTFIVEGNIGANSWNAPTQLYDPINNVYYNEDSERIRKYMYALGAHWAPIAIKVKNNKWIYPFIGIRSIWYTGFGITGDALDRLYSSDIWESYESNNNFHLSFGFLWGIILIRTDIRLTNNTGNFSVGAYDPFGVGPSYYYEVNGVDESKVMIHIGVGGLFGNL